MKVNFELVDNIALKFEERLIDLHNNFDFTGYAYKVEENLLEMNWVRSKGEWVVENECSNLKLIHRQINYLNITNETDSGNESEAMSLAEITFFPSSERSTNDCFTPKSMPDEEDDLLYVFENGQCIRIHCDEVELKVN